MEGLPQNWHFLTFPEHFLAARGHSLRNPDAFRSSLPAYNPMGASRIVSAKKHPGKVSKCSALLYAFQTNILVRPLLFPGCSLLIQSWFSQHGGPWGCGMPDVIGFDHIKTNKPAGCYHSELSLNSTTVYLWL